MKTPTIKQIKEGVVGAYIPMCSGIVQAIDTYQQGNHEGIEWTLQNIMIQDDTGEMPVRIGNHPEIPKDWVGKRVLILAHKKAKGGLSGVKLEEEQYQDGGVTKSFRQISMAKSGEIVLDEQAAEPESTDVERDEELAQQTAPQPKTDPTPTEMKPAGKVKPVAVPPGTSFTELRYERTVNLGNYCSEKMGVTVAIGNGTPPEDALVAAQIFLEKYMMKEVVPVGAKKI